MSDIDLVIGAKDRTQPAFDSVGQSVRRMQRSVRTATNRLTASLNRLKAAAGPLIAAFAAYRAIQKSISAVSSANEAFDQQTEAVQGLTTALRVNGEELVLNSARLQKFASDMQRLTGVGDEVTLGLMRQASMLGVNADRLDDVARAAIGLAEVTGQNLETSLRATQRAMQGDFQALQRYMPALRQATTAEEKLAIVTEFAAKGLDAKAESSHRLTGMVERANGALGDMMERIGQLFEPLRMLRAQAVLSLAEGIERRLVPVVELVTKSFDAVRPLVDSVGYAFRVMVATIEVSFAGAANIIRDFIAGIVSIAAIGFRGMAEDIQSAAVWMSQNVIASVTAIEVVWQNFPTVVELAVSKVQLVYETLRADTEHLFNKQLPAYMIWFAQNFQNINRDAFNATLAIFVNGGRMINAAMDALSQSVLSTVIRMGTRLSEAVSEIFRFFATGMQGGVKALAGNLTAIAAEELEASQRELTTLAGKIAAATSGSLLEGFEASTRSLPEVAARSMTEREVQLREKIGNLGSRLGMAFRDKMIDRLKGLRERLTDELSEIVKPELSSDDIGKTRSQSTTLQATESRLLTRGQSSDPLLDLARKTLDEQKAQGKALSESVARLGEVKEALHGMQSLAFVSVA